MRTAATETSNRAGKATFGGLGRAAIERQSGEKTAEAKCKVPTGNSCRMGIVAKIRK
jgi:hypothetical protein